LAENEPHPKLKQEIQSFQGLWKDGFMEGDPLHPMGASTYGPLGYISVLYATYLCCIKPYVNAKTVALEIGPGRGAWTRTLLKAAEVTCLDAVSAEDNRFWEYVGQAPQVNYIQVSDFSCSMLPDNHFNYLFSFGTLCHISFAGITEYAKNLFPKFREGSHCFVMIADYQKYRAAWANLDTMSVANTLRRVVRPKNKVINRIVKPVLRGTINLINANSHPKDERDLIEGDVHQPGRWYDAGIERTCNMLKDQGWTIIDPDVGVLHRDPIIHFAKL
jgi:hypothetical protein